MQAFFSENIHNNIPYVKLKVSSTISPWSKEYDAVIDTGAFITGIPIDDIISQNIVSARSNLKYSQPHHAKSVGFEGDLGLYEAILLVGNEETYSNSQIIALEKIGFALIGREIISLYKWEIDWKSRVIKATKNI